MISMGSNAVLMLYCPQSQLMFYITTTNRLGVEDESSSDDSEDEKTNDLSKVNEKDVSEPSSPQQPPPERGSPSERIRHKPDQSSTNNSNQADDKYASEDAIKNNSDNLVSSGDSSEVNLEEREIYISFGLTCAVCFDRMITSVTCERVDGSLLWQL